MITLNDQIHRDRFRSQHEIHTKTADGQELFVLTGVALPHWQTAASGANWGTEDLTLMIHLRDLPEGKWLEASQFAPHVTLNAIGNDRGANWAAWALDSFQIESPRTPRDNVRILCHMAGRDTDGWIYRVAYHVTLVGQFVDGQEII